MPPAAHSVKIRSGTLPVLVLNQIRSRSAIDKDILALKPGQWLVYPKSAELTPVERKRLVANLRSKWYRGHTRRRILYGADYKSIVVAHPDPTPD